MEKKEIITYDYRTITVKRDMEAMTADAYENLGWELMGTKVLSGGIFSTSLSFRRNRKIDNKQKLLAVQEKVDSTLANIDTLQKSKRSAGQVAGLSTGVVGTLVFGGGMSMVLELGLNNTGWLAGGIVLGIIGIGICIPAWFIYKLVKRRKVAKIDPMLENEYNKLSDLCEAVN